MDINFNFLLAAARSAVPRIIFTSSSHMMGGYKSTTHKDHTVTGNSPYQVGTRWFVAENNLHMDATPYATAKLAGEDSDYYSSSSYDYYLDGSYYYYYCYDFDYE
eukprot:m.151202 g.151202  ORF g.151202 m.151202 type:complete len:105 (+) comp24498_c0_seq5:496-810(+)